VRGRGGEKERGKERKRESRRERVKGRKGEGVNRRGCERGMERWRGLKDLVASGRCNKLEASELENHSVKIKVNLYRIVGLIMLSLFSCNTVKEISIEVLIPAEVTIPPDVQSVTFVNRSYTPWLAIDSIDTIRRPVNELFIIDTLLNNKFFLGVFEALNSSPLFNIEELNVIQLRRKDPMRFPGPLSEFEMYSIGDTIQADCIICLEGYRVTDTLAVASDWRHYYYDEDGGIFFVENVVFFVEGTIQWRIYDVLNPAIIDEFISTDTIEWTANGDFIQQALNELPEVVDGYREYAYQRGYDFGMRISPTWSKVKRFYFISGNRNMRKAGEYANTGKWEEAAELWKEESDSDDKKNRAKAAFNLALYSERKDLLIPAIDWAKKSYETINEKFTKTYIDILEQRKLNKLKLEQQIPLK
jgi:hypothetical protein